MTEATFTTQAAAWSSFAACYASELASYQSALDAVGEDDDHPSDLHGQMRPYYDALVAFPVETAEQLVEKTLLLQAECWDTSAALTALARDAERIQRR